MAEGSSVSRLAVQRVLEEHREAERRFESRKEQERRDRALALRLSMQEVCEEPSKPGREFEREDGGSSTVHGGWLHDGVKPRIATECLVTDGSAFSKRGKRRSLPGGFKETGSPRKRPKQRHSLSSDIQLSSDEDVKHARQMQQDWLLAHQIEAEEHEVLITKETPGRQSGKEQGNGADEGDAEMADMETDESVPPCPSHWTWCSECPPGSPKRYHLITLHPGPEYDQVTKPLKDAGMQPVTVKRIQNLLLYRRLQLERKLMEESHVAGWNVNEQNLFHVTSVSQTVIAEEGLDLRLSRQGCFGIGIYFSEDPRKCNRYWRQTGCRFIVRCKVLLGDVKEYPKGQQNVALRREPPKEHPVHGDTKTYDSVKGNVSGENEYVLYNQYRILPEYIIEYTAPRHLSLPVLLGSPAAINTSFHLPPAVQAAVSQVTQLPVTVTVHPSWMRHAHQPHQPFVFRAPVTQNLPQQQKSLQPLYQCHHHAMQMPVGQASTAQPRPQSLQSLSAVCRAFLKENSGLVKQFMATTGSMSIPKAVQYLILSKEDLNRAVSSYLDDKDSGKLLD